MKTQAFVGLVFGLALLGSTSLPVAAADVIPPAKASGQPPAVAPVVSSPTAPLVPGELPEAASIMMLPQPARSLPEGVSLTGWVGELVKLAEAGISQEVLLTFVDSAGTFNLEANQIIYLHDIGVPGEVITAVIQHDSDIASGVRQVTAGAPPTTTRLAFKSEPVPAAKPQAAPAKPAPAMPEDYADPAPAWPVADQLIIDCFDWLDDWIGAKENPEISPVRKPYAVQLTSPILVWPVQGRIPNVTLLRTLP